MNLIELDSNQKFIKLKIRNLISIDFTFFRYFKISHKTHRRRNDKGIVHVKAHVVGENQIYIFPVERQETQSGARRMVLDGPIPTFKNPNSTTSYHMNLKFSFSN